MKHRSQLDLFTVTSNTGRDKDFNSNIYCLKLTIDRGNHFEYRTLAKKKIFQLGIHQVSGKEQSIMQLNTDDLIELAETGKTDDIELDDMAQVVLHECLNMLNFEKRYYERYGTND